MTDARCPGLAEAGPYFQETLDSLAAHIAILDHEGTILAVNGAWRQYSLRNGGGRDSCGSSANYLRTCDAATGECSLEARAVAVGIRDVIAGRVDKYYLEYPCHSPEKKYWYSVRVTRFLADGVPRVVVAHDDITARKLADLKVRKANRRLFRLANTDGLTGIPNRRCFDRELERAWARFVGEDPPFTVALVDVDSFKKYNDQWGHLPGDDCLRAVARAIRARLRRSGKRVFRYGGEEFAVILPRTDALGAHGALSGVMEAVRGLAIPHPGSEAGRGVVTVSVGCSTAESGRDGSAAALLLRADRALYRAKLEGRDRLVASGPQAVAAL